MERIINKNRIDDGWLNLAASQGTIKNFKTAIKPYEEKLLGNQSSGGTKGAAAFIARINKGP